MQYAFWQTVIEVGGRYFKYELAADITTFFRRESKRFYYNR